MIFLGGLQIAGPPTFVISILDIKKDLKINLQVSRFLVKITS